MTLLNFLIRSSLLVLPSLSLSAQAAQIYITDYASDADAKVYVTQYQSDANCIVYETAYKSDNDPGVWYFTKYKSDARTTIFYTKYKSDASLIVYFTKYKSDARCRYWSFFNQFLEYWLLQNIHDQALSTLPRWGRKK